MDVRISQEFLVCSLDLLVTGARPTAEGTPPDGGVELESAEPGVVGRQAGFAVNGRGLPNSPGGGSERRWGSEQWGGIALDTDAVVDGSSIPVERKNVKEEDTESEGLVVCVGLCARCMNANNRS
jgi:hypothetical protein